MTSAEQIYAKDVQSKDVVADKGSLIAPVLAVAIMERAFVEDGTVRGVAGLGLLPDHLIGAIDIVMRDRLG